MTADQTVWERTLIGTVIFDPAAMTVANALLPSDFTGANQIIWGELLSLSSRDGLDVRSLTAALETSQDLPRITSDVGNLAPYLHACLETRGTRPAEYVDRILSNSIKRSLRRNAALIAAEAESPDKTVQEVLDYSEKLILGLRRNRMEDGMTMGDLFGAFIPRMDGFRAGTIKPAWVPKVQAVKDILQFAEATDFITVAARPGEGKSSFLRFEAYEHAMAGGNVLIFNLENDPMEYARLFLSLHTGIDNVKLKDPTRLSENEIVSIKIAAQELSRLKIRVVTLGSPSVMQIVQQARRKIAEEMTDLIMVDYVQLVRNGHENKVADVSETTGMLRGLALQTNIPVMTASQLSRGIEQRGSDAEPQLSDLRDSGTIEQDSTTVVFMRDVWAKGKEHNTTIFPENMDARNIALPRLKAIPIRFHCLKNRNGEIGVSDPVKWLKGTGRFQTLARDVQL